MKQHFALTELVLPVRQRRRVWSARRDQVRDYSSVHAGTQRGQRTGDSVAGLKGKIQTWRNRRAAVRELSRLDDRMLRDIGLTRADIAAAVAGETIPGAGPESVSAGVSPDLRPAQLAA